MDWRYNLLRIDSLSGLIVGVAELVLSSWLHIWYRLPLGFIYLMVAANLAYGTYSFFLHRQQKRPLNLIILLVAANFTWGVLCVRWVYAFSGTASFFGLAHLLLTALYVLGLAILEWRYRALLLTKQTRTT